MISLKQFTAAQVTAKDDALLYEWMSQRAACVFFGCEVTSLGSNQMRMTAGRGIILGRTFEVQQEDFSAQLADPGETWHGRVFIGIDLSNTPQPIAIKTVAAASLPELTQEDINGDGTIYQMEICTYDASDVEASNIKMIVKRKELMPWMPPGAVIPYAGKSAPYGWLICDGSAVSRTTYADLFEVIGTTFGSGDGSTTFNLPDLRGRVAVGVDSDANLGYRQGYKSKALTEAQIPKHRHLIATNYTSSAEHTHSGHDTGTDTRVATGITNGAGAASMPSSWIGSTTAVSLVQPSLHLNYLIKV